MARRWHAFLYTRTIMNCPHSSFVGFRILQTRSMCGKGVALSTLMWRRKGRTRQESGHLCRGRRCRRVSGASINRGGVDAGDQGLGERRCSWRYREHRPPAIK
ncbi:hypothetical protein B0H34DRAFT_716880 [Crassisporium funariophilum]|nr:hypothetical protein B0H34DRAFT_716880 [Crassisporium funariophilum]